MSIDTISGEQHNVEIYENLKYWEEKPLLQRIYKDFYGLITTQVDLNIDGKIVELGSGIGNLKTHIPQCITTDIFPNKWIDQVENAYQLSFKDNSVSNIILFDVWHHLAHPGNALKEFSRVLKKDGRIIIFDPAVSLLGALVYGVFHHEPIGYFKSIEWEKVIHSDVNDLPYYAAQGNATKIFVGNKYKDKLSDWNLLKVQRLSKLSYVASGGYSGKQLYPDSKYGTLLKIDKLLDFFPSLFATRLLIVLQKK